MGQALDPLADGGLERVWLELDELEGERLIEATTRERLRDPDALAVLEAEYRRYHGREAPSREALEADLDPIIGHAVEILDRAAVLEPVDLESPCVERVRYERDPAELLDELLADDWHDRQLLQREPEAAAIRWCHRPRVDRRGRRGSRPHAARRTRSCASRDGPSDPSSRPRPPDLAAAAAA